MFRLGTPIRVTACCQARGNSAVTRVASKLSAPGGMNTRGMLGRFTPFKRDSARRIDRVIDYFGETRRDRVGGGAPRPALYLVWSGQPRSRTESGVSVTMSLSARTR